MKGMLASFTFRCAAKRSLRLVSTSTTANTAVATAATAATATPNSSCTTSSLVHHADSLGPGAAELQCVWALRTTPFPVTSNRPNTLSTKTTMIPEDDDRLLVETTKTTTNPAAPVTKQKQRSRISYEERRQLRRQNPQQRADKYLFLMNSAIHCAQVSGQWGKALVWYNSFRDHQPNATTFRIVIDACVEGEQWYTALEIFSTMIDREVEPDAITYQAVQQALDRAEEPKEALELQLHCKIERILASHHRSKTEDNISMTIEHV